MRKLLAIAAWAGLLFSLLAPAAQATTELTNAPAAEVEVADSSCTQGYWCFWPYNNYQGPRGRLSGDNPDLSDFPQRACRSGTWDDCIQSVKNAGRRCTVYLFSGYYYTGTRHSLSIGHSVSNVGRWVPGFANSISSNKWCNPNP